MATINPNIRFIYMKKYKCAACENYYNSGSPNSEWVKLTNDSLLNSIGLKFFILEYGSKPNETSEYPIPYRYTFANSYAPYLALINIKDPFNKHIEFPVNQYKTRDSNVVKNWILQNINSQLLQDSSNSVSVKSTNNTNTLQNIINTAKSDYDTVKNDISIIKHDYDTIKNSITKADTSSNVQLQTLSRTSQNINNNAQQMQINKSKNVLIKPNDANEIKNENNTIVPKMNTKRKPIHE